MSKYDEKNALKLQISTYLEESLSLIGRMMLEEIFESIDLTSESEAKELVEAYYDENIFEVIAPYLDLAAQEYEIYKNTPEGIKSMEELKQVMEDAKTAAITYDKVVKGGNNNNEGNGNVH